MLGRTLHAFGSAFRMLPNPTTYHWEKKSFSMWKLLEAYNEKIEDLEGILVNDQIRMIKKSLENINRARRSSKAESEFTVATLDALHKSLDSVDDYLTNMELEYLVVGILRAHFETVLQLMNEASGERPFDDLNNATPEDKQSDFMGIYFDQVRPKAIETAPKRRFTTPMTGAAGAATPFSEKPPVAAGSSPNNKDDDDDRQTLVSRQQTGLGLDDEKLVNLNTIWCALVFRMLCWLLLHDFHKNDVQLSKSELLGSRLPVYIV